MASVVEDTGAISLKKSIRSNQQKEQEAAEWIIYMQTYIKNLKKKLKTWRSAKNSRQSVLWYRNMA